MLSNCQCRTSYLICNNSSKSSSNFNSSNSSNSNSINFNSSNSSNTGNRRCLNSFLPKTSRARSQV